MDKFLDKRPFIIQRGTFFAQIQRLRRKAKFVAYLVLNWDFHPKIKKPLFREGQLISSQICTKTKYVAY
jgi:hypothetical protein